MVEPSDIPRLLVIGAEEDCLRETERALGSRAGQVDLRWCSQPDLAPLRARDLAPHLILVYDDIGGDQVVPLVRLLSTASEARIVAVVTPESSADLARRAILAGARGFLIRPAAVEQMGSLLAEVQQGRSPRRSQVGGDTQPAARIIVFCSPKGGTGRTTLAINTAIAIHAITDEGVVLVDADYASPAVDVALDIHDAPDVSFLLPRLNALDQEFLDAILVSHESGIRALLAPPPAEGVAPRTSQEVDGILAALCGVASWVIVDLGLPMDDRARAFVTQADAVVVNVVPEAIGLRNAGRLLEWLWEHGVLPEAIRVVLNRADLPSGLAPIGINEHLGIPVAFEIPDDQALATESVNRGAPIVFDRHHTAVAAAVREFSRRLIRDLTGADHAVESTTLPRRGLVALTTTGVAVALVIGALLLAPTRSGMPFPILAAEPDVQTEVAPEGSHHDEETGEIEPSASYDGGMATDTSSPTVTIMPSPTQTPLPTETPQPSNAPVRTSTRVLTNTPLPTPTASPMAPSAADELPAPRLLRPESGATVSSHAPVILAWSWDAQLPDDAYYAVTLAYRYDGATRYVDVPWVRETSLDASAYLRTVDGADSGRFYWSVKVLRRPRSDAGAEAPGVGLCPMSQVRTFIWDGGGAPD